jgi:hypothetical protein
VYVGRHQVSPDADIRLAGEFSAIAMNSNVKLLLPFSAFMIANLINTNVLVSDLEGFDPTRHAEVQRLIDKGASEKQIFDTLNIEQRTNQKLGRAFKLFKEGRRFADPHSLPTSVADFRIKLGLI